MDDQEIRKTLEKQLQLLSERSEDADYIPELCDLTSAMVNVAEFLERAHVQQASTCRP